MNNVFFPLIAGDTFSHAFGVGSFHRCSRWGLPLSLRKESGAKKCFLRSFGRPKEPKVARSIAASGFIRCLKDPDWHRSVRAGSEPALTERVLFCGVSRP
jgi:hypothetical protein